jgi:hypothetical protein
MKHIIFVAGLALALSYPAVYADNHDKQPETKKVCVDAQGKDGKPIMDPKTKKPKQNCKEVKVHKKHEGTAVPEKKK